MISASSTLQNILKQNSSVTIDSGCTIEYNMNDMVNNIQVTVNSNNYKEINGYRPFTKIFPHDSIVKTNRPEYAGIKYGVLGDISARFLEVSQGVFAPIPDYTDPKNLKYEKSGTTLNYRTYFPGINNQYKYYLSNKNEGIDVSVEYKNIDNSDKIIFTNKIVIKFEISHSMPTSGSIKIKPSGGSYPENGIAFNSSNIKTFGTDAPGTLTIYYNGLGWSFSESSLSFENAIGITGINLEVDAQNPSTSADGDNYIGLIEIAPKYILDISSNIVSFDISKESSMDQEVAPVGIVSANSLSLSINKYDNSQLKILSYNKSLTQFVTDRIYLYKDAEIKPFFKIYYTGAPLSDFKGTYEKVSQGTYYMDSWTVDEFGSANLTALDGAKKLQQTFCPDILCKNYSSGAIIRRLLDSIGFTNYNINSASSNDEDSVVSPSYWWTESNKTIWQAIQEICKDNQMVATFDENNMLQFYTRKFLYNQSRSINWPLNYSLSGSDLPNISSLNKKELKNGNDVIVRWNAVESTESSLEGAPLWVAPTSWLGAMALAQDISIDQVGLVLMNPITTIKDVTQDLLYSFTGYLLIDSEIIEYDGIEYQYSSIEKPTLLEHWNYIIIKSSSDIKKYISKAFKPQYQYFRPSGKINIKTRGSFSTQPSEHKAAIDNDMSEWQIQPVRWA